MFAAAGAIERGSGGRPQDFHDARQLLRLVLAGKQGIPGVELGEDAPETPHVDGLVVGGPEDHLRGAIKSRLDVGVRAFVLEAAAAEVDHLDGGLVRLAQEDVLGLEVAVDHALASQELERLQQLRGESADEAQREPSKVVVLDELVQVARQRLEGDAQVIAEVEVLVHVHHPTDVARVLVTEMLEDLHLHQRLVMEPLLVPNHLHRLDRLGLVVEATHHLPERPLPPNLQNFEPIRQVILRRDRVIPALVVVSVVQRPGFLRALRLLRARARVPHERILRNLRPFVVGEARGVRLERVRGAQRGSVPHSTLRLRPRRADGGRRAGCRVRPAAERASDARRGG